MRVGWRGGGEVTCWHAFSLKAGLLGEPVGLEQKPVNISAPQWEAAHSIMALWMEVVGVIVIVVVVVVVVVVEVEVLLVTVLLSPSAGCVSSLPLHKRWFHFHLRV